ncbi:endolytic transglycosylase MltG [Carboxydochorda subterranea]|uniref:Endolytic murein transglycosylase n=1 Tax=Carboxydichorda subterranea TaxID=3109565 RepID=A0ABZ1BZT0_9FIRM|nr:endolytic transglycosylase MltG [Limnochorda sp. L945t]WRP18312.1 endolytic transglycosylase MltG [Limnochorda sp. L945t]
MHPAETPSAVGTGWHKAGRWVGIAAAAGALAVTAAGVIVAAWMMPVSSGPLVASVIIHVPQESTASQVGRELEERNLVRSGWLFALMARVQGLDQRLQAGYYRLRADMAPQEMIRILSRGAVAVEEVTIPEGSTIEGIAWRLERAGLANARRFIELASDDRWLFGESRPIDKPPGSLEGYLFPDTYRFAVGQDEEALIRKMVARFAEKVLPLYQELGAGGKLSLHQVVVLASIVEKEAMRDSERALIASVFHNRLRLGRPLQADPTLMYILHPPPKKLYRQHLAIDSPYNTYRYPGLPPTAIASPGLASIRAVLRPASTPYLYFVARGDGTHVFSRTFRDHVDARRRLAY